MLTPADIDNQEFGRQFKGYDADEVDDFLETISSDYEKLIMKNENLQQKIEELEEILMQYKNVESSLQDTLLIAKQTSDNMKKEAEAAASEIIDEANRVFNEKTGNIDQKVKEKQLEYKEVVNKTASFKRKTEALLVAQLELLNTLDDVEDFGDGE